MKTSTKTLGKNINSHGEDDLDEKLLAKMESFNVDELWDVLCSNLEILQDENKKDLIREYGKRMVVAAFSKTRPFGLPQANERNEYDEGYNTVLRLLDTNIEDFLKKYFGLQQ